MARQLRIAFPGALYHITSRGNRGEDIFFQDSDRLRFLSILKRTKERYGYLLHGYVLMDNHYHLIIETPRANITRIMQNINTSYTVYVNTRYERSGHLFQGRYTSMIVDKDAYLLELSRYIHLNPVRALMVPSPEQYLWSSFRAYCGMSGESLVDVSGVLSYFSKTKRKSMIEYRKFVTAVSSAELPNPFSGLKAGFILGDDVFVQRIKECIEGLEENDELPSIHRIRRDVDPGEILVKVAGYYGVDKEILLKRRNTARERSVAIYVVKLLSGASNEDIGRLFQIKGAAVSIALKKIEDGLEQQPELRREVAAIKKAVSENS